MLRGTTELKSELVSVQVSRRAQETLLGSRFSAMCYVEWGGEVKSKTTNGFQEVVDGRTCLLLSNRQGMAISFISENKEQVCFFRKHP